MIKFGIFASLKDVFSRFNHLNSFKWGESYEEIIKPSSSKDLLIKTIKEYAEFKVVILVAIYGKEKNSRKSRKIYEDYLEKNYPEEYGDFLDFKMKVEEKTPNIKELVFDWMDGKREIPDIELFEVY